MHLRSVTYHHFFYCGCIMLLFFLCELFSLQTDAAETKTGLIKKDGNYYYYDKNGKMVCKKWKTVNGSRYYFKKNGAAYIGTREYGNERVRVAKIGNDTYVFDSKAHMMTFKGKPGVIVSKGKFYVFKENGKLNSTKTNKVRKLAKTGMNVSALLQLLDHYGVKMVKKPFYFDTSGCYLVQGESGGHDGMLYYDRFNISVLKGNSGCVYIEGVSER